MCILYCFTCASVKLHLENNCITSYRTVIKSIQCSYFDINSKVKVYRTNKIEQVYYILWSKNTDENFALLAAKWEFDLEALAFDFKLDDSTQIGLG